MNSDTLHHFNSIRELLPRGIFVEGISILQLNITYLELVSMSFAIMDKGIISIEGCGKVLTAGFSAISGHLRHVV